MSVLIRWDSNMGDNAPSQAGRRPKKPVVWTGAIWVKRLDGEMDTRSWRSNGPMNCDQARTVVEQLRQSLQNEHGIEEKMWPGFWIKSR